MDKVKLIQVIPLPPHKTVVDLDYDEECQLDIVAYFYSEYDGKFHEVPMGFGEMNELSSTTFYEEWDTYFEDNSKRFVIIDKEGVDDWLEKHKREKIQ